MSAALRIALLAAPAAVLAALAQQVRAQGNRTGAEDDSPQVAVGQETVVVEFDELRGRIVGVDAEGVTVEFVGIPGSRVTMAREDLPADKLFLYRKARMDQGDAQAWLDLADYAEEHDLYIRRIDALRSAAELDPDRRGRIEQEIAATRSACAEDRLARARELHRAGDLEDAVEHLEETISGFAECEAGAEARSLLQRIRSKLGDEQTRAAEVQDRRGLVQEEFPVLGEAAELLQRGRRLIEQGLNNLDDYVEAKNSFEDALAVFSRARERLREMAEDGEADSAAARDELRRLLRLCERRIVNTHVELGHVYVARGDRQSAYRHVGRAAVLDPGNARVGELRQAIASIGR